MLQTWSDCPLFVSSTVISLSPSHADHDIELGCKSFDTHLICDNSKLCLRFHHLLPSPLSLGASHLPPNHIFVHELNLHGHRWTPKFDKLNNFNVTGRQTGPQSQSHQAAAGRVPSRTTTSLPENLWIRWEIVAQGELELLGSPRPWLENPQWITEKS